MTVFVSSLHPTFCFLYDFLASGKLNGIHQITSTRQRCPGVTFLTRNKEHCSTTVYGQFHTHFKIWVMPIIEDHSVTVKWRTSQKELSFYFNLCPRLKLDSFSCSFTPIFFLTKLPQWNLSKPNPK